MNVQEVKKLNLRVDCEVYLRMKLHCVKNNISMQDFVVALIETELSEWEDN
jgi:predicted HicB family RNase H-like nuclease